MRSIGIDLGTTSIKGAVLNLDTRALEHVTRQPFPDRVAGLPRLHYEVDPQAVVDATRDVLEALLAHAPDCQSITLCSQMHGVVLTDAAGKALSNVITWQDQRAMAPGPQSGQTWFEALKARLAPDDLRQVGNDLWVMRPASVLFWMAQNGQLPPGARFCALPDYVTAQLCGAPVATDYGHAAASAFFNFDTGDWHHEMLGRLGLDGLGLPRVAGRDEVIAEYRHAARAIPFHPPMADQQCSLYGAGLNPGELSVNVSTGSQVAMLNDGPVYGDFQTRPYYDGQYLLTCIHVPAGRSLNALVRLLTELAVAEGVTLQRVWENIEAMTGQTADTDLQVDLSFFAGALGNEGAITHIREDNLSAGALFRAAFDHMAANYWMLAQRISPERRWARLVFSGGLVLQMPVLRELILRRFACDYRTAEGGEDSLMGIMRDCARRAGLRPASSP
ncbi:MAG TPA: FGGY family carbohydrate kinase [Thermoflexales bacterium]|nr:FGGY family carbohydrate kinase [Thermoflexales bacterium]HQZ52939.1 FGGY family carbohydrate kinase [Thermoflexales bacterium]HRA55840.1 FGGY family carbohydrate kinase [Thermoflexales bacterium]